jgi:hypothetical protein
MTTSPSTPRCDISRLFAHFCRLRVTIAQRSKDDAVYDVWLGLLSANRAPGPVDVADDDEPPTLRRGYIPELLTMSLDPMVWLFAA